MQDELEEEKSKLQDEVVDREVDNKMLELQVERLEGVVKELEEDKTASMTIATNATQLLKQLPHNSTVRRSLLFHLSKDLSISQTASTFNISKSTVKRARKEEGKVILSSSYKYKKIVHHHVSAEQYATTMEIVDEPCLL